MLTAAQEQAERAITSARAEAEKTLTAARAEAEKTLSSCADRGGAHHHRGKEEVGERAGQREGAGQEGTR